MHSLSSPDETLAPRRPARLSDVLIPAWIVGILALITFPALTHSFASARDRQMHDACAGNLRRIGQAMNTYLADHDNCFPAWTPPQTAGFISVEDFRATAQYGRVDITKPSGARATISLQLTAYLPRTRSAWACPADFGPYTSSSLNDWAASSGRPFKDWMLFGGSHQTIDVSYGYRGTNLASGATSSGAINAPDRNGVALAGYRTDDVKRPTRCVMFWDHRAWHFTRSTSNVAEYLKGRTNCLCVDGHVVSLTPSEFNDVSGPYGFQRDIRK